MGELDVGHGGTISVFPGNCSYVHVYSPSMYYQLCQALFSYSHAHTFLSFPEVRSQDFDYLRHLSGRKKPTAVEHRLGNVE